MDSLYGISSASTTSICMPVCCAQHGAPSGFRAGDEYAAVLEQDGLGVVEAVDGGVG